MSNHRPRTDPGPSRTTITAMAALTLTIATISAWIIYGGDGLNTLDTRHIIGFILGNTLAVGVYYKTIALASERATAQARIKRFKDLEDAQNQTRATQNTSWGWTEKSYMGPHAGQATTPMDRSDTYRFIQEQPAQLEPWVTAETQTRLTDDTVETQPLDTTEAAETQALITGEAAQTQPLDTLGTAETQPLVTAQPSR